MDTGYIRIWAPDHPVAKKDGHALEHRKVLYDAGIELPKGAHVHHRNGNRQDNRLENLEVLTPAKLHSAPSPLSPEVRNNDDESRISATKRTVSSASKQTPPFVRTASSTRPPTGAVDARTAGTYSTLIAGSWCSLRKR